MAVVPCFVIPQAEFEQRRADRDAKLDPIKARLDAQGMSWEEQCKLPEVAALCHPNYLGVGAMWLAPWLFDPSDPEDRADRLQMLLDSARAGKHKMLSVHYLEQWADKRPPICVITPSMREWCVDAGSTNGTGWTVTGDAPRITCAPSIVVPGYHGYLRDGVFTENL